MSGLTIYKASAGSGKTFAITREYIHLLFRDTENYKRILGVTFTNKATAEMKSRIVADLNKLARGEKSDYSEGLISVYRITPEELKLRASLILSKILHDYSHFSILTIDSFFQRVIRAFAREIGYYQGFDIELDQDRILTEAVDQMIFDLDSNPALKDWLVKFAEEKILEGNSWDVNRDIERLGSEVFKENFKEFGDVLVEKISDKTFLQHFNDGLNQIKTEFENKLKEFAGEAVAIIKEYSLESDYFSNKYNTNISLFFLKWSDADKLADFKITNTVRNHFNDVDQWTTKTSKKKAEVQQAFDAGLNQSLGNIIDLHDDRFSIYLSAATIQKNLYVLGVVADLLKHIREYTSGKNLFLLSDSTQFLQKLISGSDAPFVFERIGTFIRHFMIDEFQDTSSLQWNNFKPLILNSLAENNENWVVGDVKQSIYRWRNSDWRILSERIFDDLQPHKLNIKTLNYNWRSSRNVIRFNNSFFGNAIELLLQEVSSIEGESQAEGVDDFQGLLNNAYSDFGQLVPEHKNTDRGLVKVDFVKRSNERTKDWMDDALDKLPGILENLQDNNYHLKDIAILVRERAEGDKVSEFLLKYQKDKSERAYRYDILSNDSLLLRNSETVKWIISVITYIVHPDDNLNKAFLLYDYLEYITDEAKISPFVEFVKNNGTILLSEKLENFLSQQSLKQFSVYELCDCIISSFQLSELKSELPFIQAFQDMLQEYTRKEPVDLNSFLQWWEKNQSKRVISMPDGQDAIRLMTFHSAKGLEFKVVIVPFGDWSFMKSGRSGGVLWCATDVAPFSDLSLLPVNLTAGLQKTIFSRNYFREKALAYVDNLNLLYVAFTRAIDALYVIVPESDKESIENSVGKLVAQSLKNQLFDPLKVDYPAIQMTDYWNEEEMNFTYGMLPLAKESLLQTSTISLDDVKYTVRSVSDVVKQVIPASEYLTSDGNVLASKINSGKIMHEVFQRIKTASDIDDSLLSMLLEGKIRETERKDLSRQIKMLVNNPKVESWFSGEWEVRTEAAILLKDGSMPRPDRVLLKDKNAIVIDYKFGESEHPSHQWQVQNYMKYLKLMNITQVEGFLWYVNLNKVLPVNMTPEQGKLF